MLRSVESELTVKLCLKISNLCDHVHTSTLRMDRRTDRQTTCLSNTALCVASRGKNPRVYENRKPPNCQNDPPDSRNLIYIPRIDGRCWSMLHSNKAFVVTRY